jgi:hypothetical protein
MIDQKRLDRFKELAKRGDGLTPVERTERDALAAEFPETAATFEPKAAPTPASGKTAGGAPGVVSAGNPTGRGK